MWFKFRIQLANATFTMLLWQKKNPRIFSPFLLTKQNKSEPLVSKSACFMENLVDLFTICHDSTAFLFPVNLLLCVPDRSHLDTSPAHPRHRCLHLWLRSRLVHTVFPSQSWDSTASVQHWNTHTHTASILALSCASYYSILKSKFFVMHINVNYINNGDINKLVKVFLRSQVLSS